MARAPASPYSFFATRPERDGASGGERDRERFERDEPERYGRSERVEWRSGERDRARDEERRSSFPYRKSAWTERKERTEAVGDGDRRLQN